MYEDVPKSENNNERSRETLVEEVRLVLEKYQDQIDQFNVMTSSKNAGGFWDTNKGVKEVMYDSRYDDCYEFHNFERSNQYEGEEKSGYVYDKEINKVTFVGYLGRTLHTPDRDGNGLFITLKLKKDFTEAKELIETIANLIDSTNAYKGRDKLRDDKEDVKLIAKEAMTILEAFEGISHKFPSNGHISVRSLIEEYKELSV